MNTDLEDLDALYETLGETEQDLAIAKADFKAADEQMHKALQDSGMSMSEYRASRTTRGLAE